MPSLRDALYPKLPVFLQNAAVSAFGYHWKQRRFGGVFQAELRGFREREHYTAEQWRDYQVAALRRLLQHAFQTVPFYARRFAAAGLTAADLARFELEDLPRLPFLEKDELRRYGRSELLSARLEHGGSFMASSGSTGTPTSIRYSHAFHQRWSAAFEARIRHWAGVHRELPRGMIGGRRVVPDGDAPPPYYRYNRFERQTYFSAYHISRATAPDYLAGMRRHGVAYMTGYAMSNYFLARNLLELGLEAPQLQAVITSSEKLTQPMRETLARAYGCRSFDSYSGIEGCALISENELGELLVSPDVGIVEVVDEQGRAVAPGETGEIVCTGLLNFDQPLIRYRIGDLVRLSPQPSRGGRAMPVVDEVVGRVEDRVVGPDGREVVRFHSVFVDLPHLLAAQVVQEALDRITVRLVTEPQFPAWAGERIRQRIRSQLGDVQVTLEPVAELPRNRNGKVQAVISRVGKP